MLRAHRLVLNNFSKSQHRPIRIQLGIQVPLVKTILKPRWNFKKADWKAFSKVLDDNIRWIEPTMNASLVWLRKQQNDIYLEVTDAIIYSAEMRKLISSM